MSPALFRAGLSYAQELDGRFGKTSIAAKWGANFAMWCEGTFVTRVVVAIAED